MWWAIGIGIVILLFYVFQRVRKAANHQQIVQVVENHIRLACGGINPVEREKDDRIWRDPYLLGFFNGSYVWLPHFLGVSLNSTEKAAIFIDAARNLIGENYKQAAQQIQTLASFQDPRFIQGIDDATKVIALMFNNPSSELLADPDVQEVLKEVPAAERLSEAIFGSSQDVGPTASAGGLLMERLMRRHKDEMD